MKIFEQLNPYQFGITIILMVCVSSFPVSAQTKSSAASTSTKTTVAKKQASNPDFSDGMIRVGKFMEEKRYALVIRELQTLSGIAKELQFREVDSTFPPPPNGFVAQKSGADHDSPYSIFNQSYKSASGEEFVITIVIGDPSIDDYVQLIQNPESVALMENSKVIEIAAGLSAFEYYSPTEKSYERQVLLGDNILMSILGHQITDRSIVDRFSDRINFSRLQVYLKQ